MALSSTSEPTGGHPRPHRAPVGCCVRPRELLAVVGHRAPGAVYREEFTWVVAALEAHTAG